MGQGTAFISGLISIVYLGCFQEVCSLSISAKMVETELAIIDNVGIVRETNVSSPLLCSFECLKIGCVGFLFLSDENDDFSHCYSTPTHFGYSGTVAETINGNICQNWADQTPYTHSYDTIRMPESNLTDAKNYCRDPSGSGYHWCFTMNPGVRAEKCNVYPCFYKNYTVETTRCYSNDKAVSYNGTLAVTSNGHACQYWTNKANSHGLNTEAKNYCRDPYDVGFTWCYTINTSIQWEQCDVTPCTAETKTCRMLSTVNGNSEYRGGYRYFMRT